MQTPHLVAASSREDWDRARLYRRTATGLLRYHVAMADPSPNRLARLLGVRDSMMAANLLALAERGPTLVNAHNGHLQRNRSFMRTGGRPVEWWSAGAIVDARRLAAVLADVAPAARVSPWFGYAPLDPAHVASTDGIVFVKDARRGDAA
ncbi:erythromycin esterase family protein [Micromonospora sp. MA102]|uniref:erythromycin esterase family protein n=1 Tax=Micromonospora sp. MA102 TaxID=2952755 RepID=UPI0021C84C49|nr:erythromycin esterase family protein [Micromonospora sp. MA102]